GLDVGDALPRAAGASRGDRGHERGGAGPARHTRLDDRRRQGRAAGAGRPAMNGVHDMGGMHGMGPIEREEHEPVFHHEWERRAFALTMAAGFLGEWNIDMARHARERIPPARYLASSYHAMGLGKKPQHLYSVRFAARELWGPDASPGDAVYVDLWDDHLDPA